MTLAELAAGAGVPPRTVRYYIARGLVPGPATAGRGAEYGRAHAERLARIRELQQRGLTLTEIARELGGEPAPALAAQACWRYPAADGVTVEVRDGLPPWRLRKVRRALAEFAARLQEGDGHDGD